MGPNNLIAILVQTNVEREGERMNPHNDVCIMQIRAFILIIRTQSHLSRPQEISMRAASTRACSIEVRKNRNVTTHRRSFAFCGDDGGALIDYTETASSFNNCAFGMCSSFLRDEHSRHLCDVWYS